MNRTAIALLALTLTGTAVQAAGEQLQKYRDANHAWVKWQQRKVIVASDTKHDIGELKDEAKIQSFTKAERLKTIIIPMPQPDMKPRNQLMPLECLLASWPPKDCPGLEWQNQEGEPKWQEK